jgi:hypothetical protein
MFRNINPKNFSTALSETAYVTGSGKVYVGRFGEELEKEGS